jgi:FkbM family methyltransferase
MNLPHTAGPISPEKIRSLVGLSGIMIEVGCHEGSDTVKFLDAMPHVYVFCFEPDQRPIARFKETMRDRERWELIEKAVSDVDGEKEWWASTGMAGGRADWDYSGSICEPTGHLIRSPEIGFKAPEPVPSIRLDTWLEENADIYAIDFAWVDIQGAQRAFLDGAQEALKIIRYLYIEAHNWRQPLYGGEPTPQELIDLLPDFEPLGVYDCDNILFRNRSFT